MPQNTNLNASPYFDDFDASKNFNRVLFKPGTPVQARELTTLQSILQNQVEKFGRHMFKEGSVVIPGSVHYDNEYTCVKVESTFFGIPVELYFRALENLRIKGKTSGVIATVKKLLPAAQSITNNTTLYIKYERSGDDGKTQKFLDGETLISLSTFVYGSTTITAGSDFANCVPSGATAIGSAFTVTKGVFFARGAFVDVQQETIILDQYDNKPSYRVGFLVKEEIITAVDDDSLYDNAAGFSNYTAPGADRLKIDLVLTKKQPEDFNDENFIELFRAKVGKKEQIVDKTLYNELAKELARRTYDESGDYYVNRFSLTPTECLNDRYSIFGTYFPEEKTYKGNIPTKDLMNLRIGPGKAYVKGFECEVVGSRILDIEKPRTTQLVQSNAIPFQAGNSLRVNNTLNGAQVKLAAANSDYVDLRDARLGSTKSTAAGNSIGKARIYDYKLQNAGYTGDTSVFEAFLFDIQTDGKIGINQGLTISTPAYIQGMQSGASAFLKTGGSSLFELELHQTTGTFIMNETIAINGIHESWKGMGCRIVTSITEYDLSDVKSIRSTAASRTFAADVVLEPKHSFGASAVNISVGSGSPGISTVTSAIGGFYSRFKVGDIIRYQLSGIADPVYNVVSVVGTSSLTLSAAPDDVSGVCDKDLPTSSVTVSGVDIVATNLRGSSSGFLYAQLPHSNVESIDLTDSVIKVRKEDTGQATDGSGQMDLPSLTGTDYIYDAFDEERYSVFYSDGTIESLTSDQFSLTSGGKGVTLSGLTASQSNVVVHSTQQKDKVKSKQKTVVRSQSVTVVGSDREWSGITTSIEDGLDPSDVWGKRVQDMTISLDYADIVEVHAVYEAAGNGAPTVPALTLASFTGPSGNNADLILGEVGIGKSSGASAIVLARNGTTKVDVCFKNTNRFKETETVVFQESGVEASLTQITSGDKNIRNNFIVDSGQRAEYYDFGRIVRKQGFPAPQGQLKIYFDYYTINSEDSGDVITANSYTKDRYDRVASYDNVRNTDVIDLRPRVAPFVDSGTRSPFEFDSRDFSGGGQAVPNVLVSDENIVFDYNFYLARTDRLYLNPNGTFTVKKGTPAIHPVQPEAIPDSFELALIEYRPYIYDVRRDVKLTFRSNKRYTMKDIGDLETRIENIEEITALSLLENATQSLVITDPDTGLDRFKNGFIVDPFNNYDVADHALPSLRYEVQDGELVSVKHFDSIDLLIGSNDLIGLTQDPDPTIDARYVQDLGSTNIRRTGNLLTLNYDLIGYQDQILASRVENVNPYMYRSWQGNLTLNPSSDIYVDRVSVVEDGGLGYVNDVIFDTDLLPNMREQNIEFVGTRLKPITEHHVTFQGIDMIDNRNYVIPKLLEVTPIQGSFQVGETVRGSVVTTQTTSQATELRCRLAQPNHKGGPYNAPTVFVNTNPYEPTVGFSSSYSETSTVLNIDTSSLNQKSDGSFFGKADIGMRLVGETSGAEAEINNLRIVSDDLGAALGCLYIPGEEFENGESTAILTSLRPQEALPGINFSRAGAQFFSEGGQITETTLTRTEPAPPPPEIIYEEVIREVEVEVINDVHHHHTNTVYETVVETVVQEVTVVDVQTNTVYVEVPVPVPVIQYVDRVEYVEVVREVEVIREVIVEVEVDPLAQSFFVEEEPGVFIGAVDLFFMSRSETIPLSVRIVTMENGYPTRNVIGGAIATVDPQNVNVANDASIATRVYFPNPVYLPGRSTGAEYAIVVASDTDEYNQWIAQVGETDITTLNESELGKVIITKQPNLGSLYKAQNASTWTPSQMEDMKYTLYRCNFTTESGTLKMFSPRLTEWGRRNQLPDNPIETFAKTSLVGIGSAIEKMSTNLTIGQQVLQNNTTASGYVAERLSHIGQSDTAIRLTNGGTGYEDGTYTGVSFIRRTGRGSGGTGIATVSGGVVTAMTIEPGGEGVAYAQGDTFTVAIGTKGLGSGFLGSVGLTTGINAFLLTGVGGADFNTSDTIQVYDSALGYGVTVTGIVPSTVTVNTDQRNGKIFKVTHPMHGNHSSLNRVKIAGITGDALPTRLTVGYAASSTGNVSVASSSGFNIFEGTQVSASNPGYALLGDELIAYTGIGNNSLTGITGRGLDGTFARTYELDAPIQKAELSGVSLRKINREHILQEVTNTFTDKTTFNTYHCQIPGDINFSIDQSGGGDRGRATTNIQFDRLTPGISFSACDGTSLTARARTTSATSISGSETSFEDKGFQDVSLTNVTEFTDPRMIASYENEQANAQLLELPGSKSFTMDLTMSTTNQYVSPVVDAFRSAISVSSNKLNAPISNYITSRYSNTYQEDPHELSYVTKIIPLENAATSLKVFVAAYRPESSDIRCFYRLQRADGSEVERVFENFPGYANLDAGGFLIDAKNNDATPNANVAASLEDQFLEYEWSADNLPPFTGFQIKINIASTNQAQEPRLLDFRAVAVT